MNILVLSAHPDDEVLGCGGTIARHVKAGDKVSVCILTDGVATRYKKGMIKKLRTNTVQAAKLLGISKVIFENLPNQLLDTVPINKVIIKIENAVKDTLPHIVYTHDKGDLNRDHVIVHEATMVTLRPLPENRVKRILTYFIPSSSEYGDIDKKHIFSPNVFVDIKKEVENKIKAFSYYRSEIRSYPHPRSLKALRIYASYWGIRAGIDCAEPFRLIREINI